MAEDCKLWILINSNCFMESQNNQPTWWYLEIASPDEDYDDTRLSGKLFGRKFEFKLPFEIPPCCYSYRGGNQYKTGRQYGFSFYHDMFTLKYGRDDRADWAGFASQSWSFFLPWTQKRRVRHDYLNLDGSFFASDSYDKGPKDRTLKEKMSERGAAQRLVPKSFHSFTDFDGEQGEAVCFLTESERRVGIGKFKWLSYLFPREVERYLDISFSIETGDGKGSFKGGTIGSSIALLKGEDSDRAFRRYCEREGMQYEKRLSKDEAIALIKQRDSNYLLLDLLDLPEIQFSEKRATK